MTKNRNKAPASAKRCRLVLVAGAHTLAALHAAGGARAGEGLAAVLAAGDVASLVLSPRGAEAKLDEAPFQALAEPLVAPAQAAGVAVMVEEHTRVAGRIGADGVQLGQDPDALADAMEGLGRSMMVAAGNVRSRHTALVLGESQPDYLMFGRPGGDTRPEPHPKNLELGAWWATMVEIPCIVLAGSDPASALAVANTGAEFVAMERAVFAAPEGATMSPDPSAIDAMVRRAAEAVARIDGLLEAEAPRFEDDAAR